MNTKHPLYKEKKKIERELGELYDIQRNQNWIELETPYKHGYDMVFDLRDDIKNRDDAWVFYECIKLVGNYIWCANKSFKKKIKKGKYEYLRPSFGEISEKTYENLHPAVKKYFTKKEKNSSWYGYSNYYACTVPSFYFIVKTKPHWITHYKEHDAVVIAEIAEKSDYIRSKKFWSVNSWFGDRGSLSSYAKYKNRSDRAKNKQALHRNVREGGEFDKYEYRYNHKHSAIWEYW